MTQFIKVQPKTDFILLHVTKDTISRKSCWILSNYQVNRNSIGYTGTVPDRNLKSRPLFYSYGLNFFYFLMASGSITWPVLSSYVMWQLGFGASHVICAAMLVIFVLYFNELDKLNESILFSSAAGPTAYK